MLDADSNRAGAAGRRLVDGAQPQRPAGAGQTVRVVDLDGLELMVDPEEGTS